LGPYTPELGEMFIYDVTAGITVALTLVPQVLGFAQLANLPPIVGLYTSVLPSCVYLFFGSSMALAVGPTAILSLLTGQLVSENGVEPGSEAAVDLAGQATFCCGIILLIMAVLNLGVFIQLISHPVMRYVYFSMIALYNVFDFDILQRIHDWGCHDNRGEST
jgi:sulfate permease, SulP family